MKLIIKRRTLVLRVGFIVKSHLQGGLHIITLLDAHVAIAAVPVVCGMEILGAVYTYGPRKFSIDVLFMTGKPLMRFWLIMWRYIIPVLLVVSM